MINVSAFALIFPFLLLSFLLIPCLWWVPPFSSSFSPRSIAFPRLPTLVPLTFMPLPCSSCWNYQVSDVRSIYLLFIFWWFWLCFTYTLGSLLSCSPLTLPSPALCTHQFVAMAGHSLEFEFYFFCRHFVVHGILKNCCSSLGTKLCL